MHQRIQVKPGTHVPQTHPPPRSVHLPVQKPGSYRDPRIQRTVHGSLVRVHPLFNKKVKKYKIVDFGLVLLI